MTSDDDCERLVDATVERFGRVDILVNNAGTAVTLPAEVETPTQFRGVIDVNLNGLFVMSQLAGRRMIEQGSGSIVNIASMLGLVASTPVKQASYCASKGAVVNLTRELAAQWARKGVRVNALAPGWFPTEMTAEMVVDDLVDRVRAADVPDGPLRRRSGARRRAVVPRVGCVELLHRPDPRHRRRLDRPVTIDALTRDAKEGLEERAEEFAGAGALSSDEPNSAARKSVAPASAIRSMPACTVFSSPTSATSAGPAAPSRSNIAR